MDAQLKKFLVFEPGQIEALEMYMKEINAHRNKAGVKKGNAFETIWEAAHRDGAKWFASEIIKRLYDIRTKGFSTGGQEQEE